MKVSVDSIDMKQNILEIVKQLQGEISLEYDKNKQDVLIQTQNYIIDQKGNIFQLNDHNKLFQDPLQNDQYFNEVVGISKKNYFYEKAKHFSMKIFPDQNFSEYKTKEQLNPLKQQHLEQINQQISKIILFSVFCKNQIEKNSKKNFYTTTWTNQQQFQKQTKEIYSQVKLKNHMSLQDNQIT
ncbi:unnamed protein product (macronuclear) [Paramecium tetraurelia]|uniref:Uncharacterized protein n=1 Tax=Paramecium tetraurelia TaxID=5888 RepID=A0BRB9_PARTE|nr:uncharacterized protein GSPATT00031317001 [Paramecium tetraurelia]CAK61086.1 unnamed protein product [Paramecium tetraurelia]|eukprot:XP_001428484.1 hypothetical protein (macronuclear) [Paramecium tetraurelia strain d4-2]